MRIAIVFFIDFPSYLFIAKPNISPTSQEVNDSLRKQFLEQIGVFHQLIAQSFVIFVSHISLFCHISCLMKININPVERNRFLILFTRLVFFYSLFITSQKLTDM